MLGSAWQGVFACVALVLLLNYVVFIVTILAYRATFPFRSIFFTLTLTLGCVDIAQMVATGLFIRLPSFGWTDLPMRLPSWIVALGSSMMWGLAFSQHMAILFIALNRYSAIVMPHSHREIWKRWTRPCLTFIFVSGVVFVIPKMVLSRSEYKIAESGTLRAAIIWRNEDLMRVYKYVSAVLSVACNTVAFICYAAICRYTIHRRSTFPSSCVNRAAAERRRVSRRASTISKDTDHFMNGIRAQVFGDQVRASSMTTVEEFEGKRKKSPRVLLSRSSLRLRQYGGAGARYMEMLREKREMRLAFCGFIMFLFMLAYAGGVMYLAVDGDAKAHSIGYLVWQATSDLCAGVTPILILAISRTARRRYLCVITCGRRGREMKVSTCSLVTTNTHISSLRESLPRTMSLVNCT